MPRDETRTVGGVSVKSRSAKNKGQRASKELKKILLEAYPELHDDDIKVVPAGVTGEDLWLSPAARKLLPFTFEVKNQETWKIPEWLRQSLTHAEGTDYTPLLIFKRNRESFKVCLELTDFLKLLNPST